MKYYPHLWVILLSDLEKRIISAMLGLLIENRMGKVFTWKYKKTQKKCKSRNWSHFNFNYQQTPTITYFSNLYDCIRNIVSYEYSFNFNFISNGQIDTNSISSNLNNRKFEKMRIKPIRNENEKEFQN